MHMMFKIVRYVGMNLAPLSAKRSFGGALLRLSQHPPYKANFEVKYVRILQTQTNYRQAQISI